jgi:photosystem II stability/assembly factor-like uncharacterized protein
VGWCWKENIGSFDLILRTTDGGATWMNQSIIDEHILLSIYFTNEMVGTAAGRYIGDYGEGEILRTTDGGITWTIQYTLRGTYFKGVCFTDADNGTVVGSNQMRGSMPAGYIFRTTNGGATWIDQSSGITQHLNAVCFTDANTGTVVGYSGTILRTTNGGTLVENQPGVPQQYLLSQNYPNPFNPITTITYELLKSSEVTLTVYDVLGREVSVLVNEKRNAGVHEVKFDGSNLASGIYFYRLKAGTYINTKKLVLLK